MYQLLAIISKNILYNNRYNKCTRKKTFIHLLLNELNSKNEHPTIKIYTSTN